jgi:hypothetical protein
MGPSCKVSVSNAEQAVEDGESIAIKLDDIEPVCRFVNVTMHRLRGSLEATCFDTVMGIQVEYAVSFE